MDTDVRPSVAEADTDRVKIENQVSFQREGRFYTTANEAVRVDERRTHVVERKLTR